MSNHAIIIRMWYQRRADFERRLALFRSICLPRLQAQTRQAFDICILSDPQDFNRLEALDTRIRPFTLKSRKWSYVNFSWDQIEGMKQYEIQTRIDSDDMVHPTFVQNIEVAFAEDPELQVVTWQPELFIFRTLEKKKMRHRYSEGNPSMFLSFRQDPDTPFYRFVYHQGFGQFGRFRCKIYPEGFVYMGIHGDNKGTNENS